MKLAHQLLLLGLAALSTSAIAEDGTPLVCVGTAQGGCDIISDSKVTDSFQLSKEEESDANLYTIASDVDSMDLYITVKSGFLQGAKIIAVSEDGVTEPKVSFPLHGKDVTPDTADAQATLAFNCAGDGDSVVTVMLLGKNFAADTSKVNADMKPEEVMASLPGRFKLKKQCGGVQAGQDAITSPWLNICDADAVESAFVDGEEVKKCSSANVVFNGHVKQPFTIVSDDKLDNLKVIPEDVEYIEFYLGTKPGETVEIGEPEVLSEAGICRPVLSGNAISGGTITHDKGVIKQTLTVTFNCRSTGESPVSLTIPLLPEGSATVSVVKKCKVDEESGPVKQEWSIPGLNIMTKDGEKIAKNGLTKPDFTESGAATSRSALVGPQTSSVDITIFMSQDEGGADSQNLEAPIIFVTDPSILAASIDNPVLQVTQAKQAFTLSLNCASKGSTVVTVSLPIPNEVGELKFSLQKICEPSDLEEIEAVQEQEEAQHSQEQTGLQVGTSMDSRSDVVKGGLATEWSVATISKKYGPSMEDIKAHWNQDSVSLECDGCLPDSFDTLPEIKGAIATCEAKMSCSVGEAKKLLDGLSEIVAEKIGQADPNDAPVVPVGTYSMDFFLSVPAGFPGIHLGHAEAYSLDETVSQPRLLGPGSSSTVISDKPSRLAVAFDCAGTGGTTVVVIKLPLFAAGKKSAVITYGMVKHCAAINATEFGGSVADNPEMSMEIEEVVQRAGSGLNIGTGLEGDDLTDVVANGIVMPKFLTASKAGNQDAGGYRLDADSSSFKLFVSSAEPEGAEPITVGVPQVVSFNPKVAKVSITEESAISKKYAKKGKFRLEEPLELVLNFECLSTGVAVIAVGVPLRTRGTGAHFEFSKACETTFEPTYTGDKIEGLKVGTTSGGDEVVRDGQVNYVYGRVKATKAKTDKMFIAPSTKSSTFYISADPSIEIGKPVVVSHRPVISPTLTGLSDGSLGSEKELTVKYNCVWEGQTQVTFVIPLVNMDGGQKQIVWAVTKRCTTGGSDVDNDFSVSIEQMDLMDHDNDGVLGPEYEEWMDWADYEDDDWDEWEAYDFEESWDYYDYWDPWDNMENDEYFDDWYDNFDEEAYFWYDEEYDYDYAEFDDFWEYGDYDDYDSLLGTLGDEGWDVENDLSIGTHENKSDVVDAGYTQPRYKMCEPEPGLPCDIQAMINSDLVTFYVRSVEGEEVISGVEAKPKYKGSVEATIRNIKSLVDKPVFPDSATEIEVEMTCLRQGVTSPVLITVFYDHNISFESFSIIKVCGKEVSAAAVAIETTTLLIGFGVLASVVLSFIAGHKLKKFSDGRDLSA